MPKSKPPAVKKYPALRIPAEVHEIEIFCRVYCIYLIPIHQPVIENGKVVPAYILARRAKKERKKV